MKLLTAFSCFFGILIFLNKEACSGPPAYKYDLRRTSKQNQASPGIYFDPQTGQFKRGNPPPDLLEKSKQLRKEVKQGLQKESLSDLTHLGDYAEFPFAKYADNEPASSHRYSKK